MEPDLPDEADESPDGNADRRDDQDDGGQAVRPGNAEAEPRNREEYYADLRDGRFHRRVHDGATDHGRGEGRSQEVGQADRRVPLDLDRVPAAMASRASALQSIEPPIHRPPGVGDRNRFLDSADNSRVEAACDRIADRERERITPAMRALESQDPDRHLIGFDDRLKGRDRIKEKVYDTMEEVDSSVEEAVSIVPDAIRYTLQYRDAHYTQGVWADITRMKDQGFELLKIKNSWSGDQYKGVNSQWIEVESGQRFEVQFHTRISYEAKQLTHDAYDRIRSHQADKFEQIVLEAFQKKVADDVPVPPGAADIPDYP